MLTSYSPSVEEWSLPAIIPVKIKGKIFWAYLDTDSQSFFSRESSDDERLYSLDVLGVRGRGEDDEFDVHTEFKENVVRKPDGRYEVNIPWIPGAKLDETNEEQSRRRLQNMERKLGRNEQLKADYKQIVEEQLEEGIVERIPTKQTGERVFYLPHKPVVRTEAVTTKVRMVFDAGAKLHPLAASINECMYTGPSLQPLLWDIMIRSRMSENLLLGDIKKAFLQIGIKRKTGTLFGFSSTLTERKNICYLQEHHSVQKPVPSF